MADPDEEKETGEFCRRSVRRTSVNSYVTQRNAKLELREKVKKVTEILKKPEQDRTAAEKALVKKHPEIVKTSERNARRLEATKNRVLEIEDEPQVLDTKCNQLADLIRNADRIVVYTGAGISTAASIPDYRGPNGVWTLLKKGQEPSAQDLSDAEPTFTHMSITKLFRAGLVKHIVSQNCDGLHIRSGYPRYALSEVHGNMYIECCYSCNPHKEYIRLFDVTEKTGVRRHTTGRRCRTCGSLLTDTIVHFGEKGKIKSPYRWKEAVRAAKNSDLILCLGSSLKILRRYTCLWAMDRKPHQRPKLVIVNLQWTPKDDLATLKINGRCDYVMKRVMNELEYEVPEYKRETDPIFKMCTPLRASELKTTSKKILIPPFLPDKTPSKASKKSRSKKSRSRRSSHIAKPKKCATVSSKPDLKEELLSSENESKDTRNRNTSFPKACEDSEIKANWDTPILALESTDEESNVQWTKEALCSADNNISDVGGSTGEIDSLTKNVSDIKSEKCGDITTTTKTEPNAEENLKVKGKMSPETAPRSKYEAIDVVLEEESQQDPTDICQVNLDAIKLLPPVCHVQLAGNARKRRAMDDNCKNEIKAEFELSHLENEASQPAEYMSEERLELDQPIPGTVVIDLEVVDEFVDNFSFGNSKLAQVGMSLSNVLLINLDSKQVDNSNYCAEDTLTQTNLNTDTCSLLGKAKDQELQEDLCSTKIRQPNCLSPVVLDSKHLCQGNKDENNLVGSSASLSSSEFEASFKQYHSQPVSSVATVSVTLDSSTNLIPSAIQSEPLAFSSQRPKPVSLPSKEESSPYSLERLVSPHEFSSSKHLLQTVSTLTSSVAGVSMSCSTLSKICPNDVQVGSKSLPLRNVPLLFSSSIRHNDKLDDTTKRKDHENLRQLLNKPVSVQNHGHDSSYIGFTAKKLISSMSYLSDKSNGFPGVDHAYSQRVKAKENGKAYQNSCLLAGLPVGMEDKKLVNLDTQVNHESQKSSAASPVVSHFASLYESCEGQSLTSPRHDVCDLAKTSKSIKPVLEHSSSVTPTIKTSTMASSGSSEDSSGKVQSVPLCVLNMDDILKPKMNDDFLSTCNSSTVARSNSQTNFSQHKNMHLSHLHETFLSVTPHRSPHPKSSSPFQAVSLHTSLSSPHNEVESENTLNDKMITSPDITEPVNFLSEEELKVPPTEGDVNMTDINCGKLDVVDNSRGKTKETSSTVNSNTGSHDAHHSPVKNLTKSCPGTVNNNNNAKSRKRHSTSSDPHPLKPVKQSSPEQRKKNNNKRSCKSQKRTTGVVGRPPKNGNNKKVPSESMPGWFGKGLAIKIKRKKKA